MLKKCLTRYAFPEKYRSINPTRPVRRAAFAVARGLLKALNLEIEEELWPIDRTSVFWQRRR